VTRGNQLRPAFLGDNTRGARHTFHAAGKCMPLSTASHHYPPIPSALFLPRGETGEVVAMGWRKSLRLRAGLGSNSEVSSPLRIAWQSGIRLNLPSGKKTSAQFLPKVWRYLSSMSASKLTSSIVVAPVRLLCRTISTTSFSPAV